jgi:hypothetical protein
MMLDLVSLSEFSSSGFLPPSKAMYDAERPHVQEVLRQLTVPVVTCCSPKMMDEYMSLCCSKSVPDVELFSVLGARVVLAKHFAGHDVLVAAPASHESNLSFASFWLASRQLLALSWESALQVIAQLLGMFHLRDPECRFFAMPLICLCCIVVQTTHSVVGSSSS